MEFSRQEYWSQYSLLQEILSTLIKPRSPALQKDFLLSELPGKPDHHKTLLQTLDLLFSTNLHKAPLPCFLSTPKALPQMLPFMAGSHEILPLLPPTSLELSPDLLFLYHLFLPAIIIFQSSSARR